MSNTDEFVRYAAECIALAQRTNDPEAKARLTQMAQAWRELAERLKSASNRQ